VGNFYTNITVLGRDGAQVAAQLLRLTREAFVADVGGSSVVYDRECDEQRTEILGALAERLSRDLEAKSFAVLNHDDDALWFQLYDRSDLIAEYSSRGGPRTKVRALCRALGRSREALPVWILLKRPFVFELSRHRRLARRLDLPEASVGAGFEYVRRGETPPGVHAGQLLQVQRGG
jgi:hypothetical protein